MTSGPGPDARAPLLVRLRDRLVPEAQRRTLDELTEDLDLRSGDRASKYSSYWTMLVLSSVIAAAGVMGDSTATVIGAMIIAPLSTPIMGVALSLVKRARMGAGAFVAGGVTAVVVIGLVASMALPTSYDLLANSQISGRTSPGLADLLAAMATGLAGAVAMARRDVANVLPGVAIAISLVPPLVVAGFCLGAGEPVLALGAMVLFLSNMVFMILAGTFVFAALGHFDFSPADEVRNRSTLVLSVAIALIVVALVANTTVNYLVAAWSDRVRRVATEWVSDRPGARVTGVRTSGRTFHISVRAPGDLPPGSDLLARLDGVVPDGLGVVVDRTQGRTIDVGTVGS